MAAVTNTKSASRWKSAALAAAQPAFYTAAFMLLVICWRTFNGPTPEEIITFASEHIATAGLLIVAVAALLEGLVVITLWFPGSLVLLVAMTAARGRPDQAAMIVLTIIIAFTVSAQINYLVGRHGLHALVARLGGERFLERASRWYERYGTYALPPLFIHPSLGSFISVASGQARLPWRQFLVLSGASITVWNIVWGCVLYFSARLVTEAASRPDLILGGLLVWTLIAFLHGTLRPAN
jgi:membrane protein DedA with SNARE-associated domain